MYSRRLLVLLTLLGLLSVPSLSGSSAQGSPAAPRPAARRTLGVGFAIPHPDGRPGSWIGSYLVDGRQAYCADPLRDGPRGGRYASRAVRHWRRPDGSAVPSRTLSMIGWVLSRHGRTSNPVEAAAVDSIVYALAAGGVYRVGGPGFMARMNATGHGPEIRAAVGRYLHEARAAGAWRLRLGHLRDGNTVRFTATLTAAGTAVSGIRVRLGSSTARTGRAGMARFAAPVREGSHRYFVRATGLPSPAVRMLVPRDGTQRMWVAGLTTELAATTVVRIRPSRPALHTVASRIASVVGEPLHDIVEVSGIRADTPLTVHWALYGPFAAAPGAGGCIGTPYVSGQFVAEHDGRFLTPDVLMNSSGWFTFVEWSGRVVGSYLTSHTTCGERVETARVDKRRPGVGTVISAQDSAVGAAVHDTVAVTGAGDQPLQIQWRLLGPGPATGTVDWANVPSVAVGTLAVPGDGHWQTPPFTVTRPGRYTYVESVAETATTLPLATPPGLAAETALVKARPMVSTTTSQHRGDVGIKVRDLLRISGTMPGTSHLATVALFGPFAGPGAARCSGRPAFRTTVRITGDGTYSSARTVLRRPGVYTWQVEFGGDRFNSAYSHPCGLAAETTLVTRPVAAYVPEIPTGGSLPMTTVAGPTFLATHGPDTQPRQAAEPRFVTQRYVAPAARARGVAALNGQLRLPRLGIVAPVDAVDLDRGVLAVPNQVGRVGWLARSAQPGDVIGSAVIAGHVSDRHDRPGALWRLRAAKVGDVIVWSEGGQVRRFRVTSLRRVPRDRPLPGWLMDVTGPMTLRLVTCADRVSANGGGFHYRNNLVVSARPVP